MTSHPLDAASFFLATPSVAVRCDIEHLFNDLTHMNSSPCTLRYAITDDPATIRMLVATIRLCLQLPGSIKSDSYDDVGFLLHPVVAQLRERLRDQTAEEITSGWSETFDQASADCDYECCVWLGKSLSRVTKNLLPMYESVLTELIAACNSEPFKFGPNVLHLSSIFSFDDVETRILELAACAEQSSFGFDYLRIDRPTAKVHNAIAAAIGMPAERVTQAFQWGSRLARSGIFQASFDGTAALDDILDLSNFGKQVFNRPFHAANDLFEAILETLPAPAHTPPLCWPSLSAEQLTVEAILDTALKTAEPGINILLSGASGNGKTEFARHLVNTVGCAAYEVPYKDKEGNEASRIQRLASLQIAQSMLGNGRQSILVLDEAEDIFQDDFSGERRSRPNERTGSKAWMNRLLETNQHPVIWITNSIDDMDPAYLRRYTFCIHFDTPDASVRRLIAERHLGVLGVTDAVIASVAQRREFSLALISASARVVQLAAGKAGSQDEVVMCHLNSQAKTMQQPAISQVPQSSTRFDTAYLQVEGRFSAQQVMDAVVRRGAGTVLMSGPPGTGKTQLAKTIAERLGRELLYFTASDINRKWFGESEQQVARMFASCNPKQQLIFLDEAETVLGERDGAMHRGSEAVTAEFLRQLEPFPGVFLCATNHGHHIDSALIRRFTFRLEFKPMSRVQREMMFRELLALPQTKELRPTAQLALGRLDGLTPGDFANVKKRFDLIGLAPTLDDWLAELQQEWRAKPNNPSTIPIGFV